MTEPEKQRVAEHYCSRGYHVWKESVLGRDIVARARAGMEQLMRGEYDTGSPPLPSPWKPGDDPRKLCKIEMPQLASRAIAELIGSKAIGTAVAGATGATQVQVWWVQMLVKPPTPASSDAATRVGWHQDWSYWNKQWTEGSELLTAWVALRDVDETSGPMIFVEGSHRWGMLDGGDFFDQSTSADHFQLPDGAVWQERAATMPAGGMSLHDRYTLHGSGLNQSSEPRMSFAIHLRTEKSEPISAERVGFQAYLDDPTICPVIYG
ncbi:MAG: phytanoyl-CoA dioxygenase family protein [Verrucomicrobia bacterium]|nr:phytanoyl-CoA dioxygenase family protein [Verrucomicrobiota bacterium]